MKKSISILAALAIASPSFADVTIRITGSTAMRSAVHSVLTTGLGYTNTAWTANSANSASSASFQIYTLGTSPNQTVVKTSWSGSVAGVQAIAQSIGDLKYLPDGTTGTALASNTAVAESVSTPADIAFSDVYQQSSPFTTPVLSDTICGVVQFRWVTSYGSPITNITPQQVRTLYLSGSLPLSAFTGNVADAGIKVYALGRDPDSGTRGTAFAENGLGPLPTVFQYKPVASGGVTSSLAPYAPTTKFGISLIAGNDGEASGGSLASFLRNDNTAVSVQGGPAETCHFVAYLGTSDAATATAAAANGQNPGSIIGYNGSNPAPGTALVEAIKNGSYHFWSYLHAMHNGLSGQKLTFYNTITSTLQTTSSGGLKLSDMNVERANDGADITPR